MKVKLSHKSFHLECNDKNEIDFKGAFFTFTVMSKGNLHVLQITSYKDIKTTSYSIEGLFYQQMLLILF